MNKKYKALLEKAKESEVENFYLLPITLSNGNGSLYDLDERLDIVEGEIDKILMKSSGRYNHYDVENEDYLIIPKSPLVILVFRHRYVESGLEKEKRNSVYVFQIEKGWIRV